MTQSRVWDFGALLTQARANAKSAQFLTPGVYYGFNPSIGTPTTISFAPGVFLLPNGVLVSESAAVPVTVPTPGVPTDYTITADHDNIAAVGGSSVYYTVRTGLRAPSGDPNANSLALLWIRHPGVAPLAASMLSTPPQLQAGSPVPPLPGVSLRGPLVDRCDALAGPNIQVTAASHSSGPQNLGLKVLNTAGVGLQTYQFRLPLPPFLVRTIEVYADIPAFGSVSISTAPYTSVLSNGTVLASTPASIVGPVALSATPAGVFTLAAYDALTPPVTLGVTVTVPPLSASVFLREIRLLGDA